MRVQMHAITVSRHRPKWIPQFFNSLGLYFDPDVLYNLKNEFENEQDSC